MRVVIAPDSFKGSLLSDSVSNAIEEGIRRVSESISIYKVPMADGGEGTVKAIISAVGGDIVYEQVTGPIGEKVNAFYGILYDGMTAVIEMAAASGLPLVPEDKRNPLLTTTYGTGELMRRSIEKGCSRLIIGIGGSATNDGGVGMLQALGAVFLDSDGVEIGTRGWQLERIESIDMSGFIKLPDNFEIIVACDVKNSLCGPEGASYVFGPQKGATPEILAYLDRGLSHFADKVKLYTNKDIKDKPGSGAAGGLGFALEAFLNAELRPGIEIIKEFTALEEKIMNSDLIITGEGKTDLQTLFGKLPVGVAGIARKYKKTVVCLSGGLGEDTSMLYEEGITSVFSIVKSPMTLEEAMRDSYKLISEASENIIRLFIAAKNINDA